LTVVGACVSRFALFSVCAFLGSRFSRLALFSVGAFLGWRFSRLALFSVVLFSVRSPSPIPEGHFHSAALWCMATLRAWEAERDHVWKQCLAIQEPSYDDFCNAYAATYAICPVPLADLDEGIDWFLDELLENMVVEEQIRIFFWIVQLPPDQAVLFEGWEHHTTNLLRSKLCTDQQIHELLQWTPLNVVNRGNAYYCGDVLDLLNFAFGMTTEERWPVLRKALQPFVTLGRRLPRRKPQNWHTYKAKVAKKITRVHDLRELQYFRWQLALALRCPACIRQGCLVYLRHSLCEEKCLCCRFTFEEDVWDYSHCCEGPEPF